MPPTAGTPAVAGAPATMSWVFAKMATYFFKSQNYVKFPSVTEILVISESLVS